MTDAHISNKTMRFMKPFFPDAELRVNSFRQPKHCIIYEGIETKEAELNRVGKQFFFEMLQDVSDNRKIAFVCNSISEFYN